jgi:hypothetical protein
MNGSSQKQQILQDLKKPQEGNLPGIILGVELAKHLAASVNDVIQVISPLGTVTPMGMMPKMKRFRVAGIFYSGMYEFDNTLAYISIESAQRFFNMDSRVTGIEIKVNDIYKAKEIGKEIQHRLGFSFWPQDWMEMNRNLFSAMKLEKILMFIILVLIILVAAFNIISTLIMVVMEKYKDIAIICGWRFWGKTLFASFRSMRCLALQEVRQTSKDSFNPGGGIYCCSPKQQHYYVSQNRSEERRYSVGSTNQSHHGKWRISGGRRPLDFSCVLFFHCSISGSQYEV